MIYIKQTTAGIILMAGGLLMVFFILTEENPLHPMIYILMILYFVIGLWLYRNHLPVLGKYSKSIYEDGDD